MGMKTKQKQKIVDEIVDDFNEHQVHDSYWFENSETQIEWSRPQEIYLILYRNKTWDYCEPKHLFMYIEDLHEKDLKNYNSMGG